jgi:hypothetical protein
MITVSVGFSRISFLVEDEVDLAAENGDDVECVGPVHRGVALPVFLADLLVCRRPSG